MKLKAKKSEIVGTIKEAISEIMSKQKLQEGVVTDDLLPGAEGKLSAYLTKVEKFIDETIEKAGEIADEGEELLRSDFTQSPNVGERNRLLLMVIGTFRKLRFNLATLPLEFRKMIG